MAEEEDLLHVNPCPPSWLSDEQKAVLRGDNVEGTAYTQRWLLNTLMTILKALHELLPLLQNDTNLTTYDFTPRKCQEDDSSRDPATPHEQPLPGETPTFSPQHTNGNTAPCTPQRDLPGDQASVEQQDEDADPALRRVVEVPSDVEDAACQLWDMCSDRHVALHVLQLSDNLVLHMLGYALRDPTAPRLTEILCGVVWNLCCQQEGCKAVLADQPLLLLLTSLSERCIDSPALIQAFRLLHRLLSHCRHGHPQRDSLQPTVRGDQSIGTAGTRSYHSYSAVPDMKEITGSGPSRSQDGVATGGITNGTVHSSPSDKTVSVTDSQDGDKESSLTAPAADPTKALAVALHSCNLEHFLAFILMNSFRGELVTTAVELLEQLLFLVDPHSGKFMADFYAESGLVSALLRLASNWCCTNQHQRAQQSADDVDDDRDDFGAATSSSSRAGKDRDTASVPTTDTVQKVFICLYAFVDTKGSDAIVSNEDDELRLEPALVHYISELVSGAEAELRRHKSHDKPTSPTVPPLADGDDTDCAHSSRLRTLAERLGYAVKLLELLVRSVSLPEVNLALARLLALLDHSGVYWEEDEGGDVFGDSMEVNGCSKTCSTEDLSSTNSLKTTRIPTLRSKSCEEPTSQMKSKPTNLEKKRKDNPNKSKNILDHFDILAVANSSIEAKGKKKAQEQKLAQSQIELMRQAKLTTGSRCRRRSSLLLENSFNDINQVRDAEEISCLSSSTLEELRDLRRCLEKYFSSVLHYWFMFGELKADDGALCRILRVFEQCHVHELLLVLHALRKFDQALVPRVQELLLDHQAFPRIVALLAKLYQ